MSDIVQFDPGVPQQVQLAFTTGKEVDGKFGPRFMYSLEDGRVMFASEVLNDKIQAMRPRKGDVLEITLGRGNQWTVAYSTDGPGIEAQARPTQQGIKEPNIGNGSTNGHGNGNGNGHSAAAIAAPASLMTGQSQGMLDQFIAAYEVLVAVEKYSQLKGRAVTFTSEDYRATAISCYIQQSKGGR